MKALVYRGPGKRSWRDKPKPALSIATDAILKITKTTLCASDLPIINEGMPNLPEGLTLGHEGVGIVEEVGSEVSMFKIGDKAMITCAPSCGKCESCMEGKYSTCEHGGWTLGRLIDGTLAEYVRVPDADTNLQHIPEGVDESTLLMLKDILPSGLEYRAPDGQIQPGDTVVIFGSGPIGVTALLMAQFHLPSEIIMVDTNRRWLESAGTLGATKLVHASGGDAINDIMRLSGGKSVDVAIVANANVALNSIWRSYGQPKLPLRRVLLMPSLCLQCWEGSVVQPERHQGVTQYGVPGELESE